MSKVAIAIDGDWLAFSTLSGAQVEDEWGEGVWVLKCDHNAAFRNVTTFIKSIRKYHEDWEDADIILTFSDPKENFRKKLYPQYKLNRMYFKKPLGYTSFVNKLHKEYLTIQAKGLEADDVMGILATNPKAFDLDYERVDLVSVDKDFMGIPCNFLHIGRFKKKNKLHVISKEDADRWHLIQTLVGDLVDGYKGVKGFGYKSAEDFLDDPYLLKVTLTKQGNFARKVKVKPEASVSVWDCIINVAQHKGQDEQEVLLQARLARILRDENYNQETGEITLWTP